MNDSESNKQESAGSRIFGQLPSEKRDEIIRAMENQSVAPGTIIFRQGDPGESFYIIRSGKVRMFREDADGFETDLSVLRAGESFGEMALLTGEARSANVEAVEETRLMVLSKAQFKRILEDSPDISLAFVKQMSIWLTRDNKIIAAEVQQLRQARRATWLDFLLVIGVSVILAIMFNKANPNGIPLFPESPDRKAIPEISAAQAMEETKKGETLIVDAGPAKASTNKSISGEQSVCLFLFLISSTR